MYFLLSEKKGREAYTEEKEKWQIIRWKIVFGDERRWIIQFASTKWWREWMEKLRAKNALSDFLSVENKIAFSWINFRAPLRHFYNLIAINNWRCRFVGGDPQILKCMTRLYFGRWFAWNCWKLICSFVTSGFNWTFCQETFS